MCSQKCTYKNNTETFNLSEPKSQFLMFFLQFFSRQTHVQKLHSSHNIKATFPGHVLPQTEALRCVHDVKDTGTGTALSGAFPHSAHSDNQIKHSMENRRVPR